MSLERKGGNRGRSSRKPEIAPPAQQNPTGAPADGSRLRREIGHKLKVARQHQQLSLRALAAKVDFSASFLSQVELGQVSPSIGSLDRIAQALGMHLSDLLSQPISLNGPVLRHGREASLHSEWSHATIESLLPVNVQTKIGVLLMRLEPGGQRESCRRLLLRTKSWPFACEDGQRSQSRRSVTICVRATVFSMKLSQ
jgi:transcriptional regulator with XRE-family HTH domain